MGKVMSMITKPMREFNVESRAFKVISKEKPTPAPRHKSDEYDVQRLMRDYSKEYEESLKKHETLDTYLKDVFVTSHDPEVKQAPPNPDKPLPLDRNPIEDYELGYKEPSRVPLGKVTLRDAIKFITHHQTNPEEYTVPKISEDYNLPQEAVKNVLKYFKIHEVYVPEDARVGHIEFFGPPPQRQLVKMGNLKQLPPGGNETPPENPENKS